MSRTKDAWQPSCASGRARADDKAEPRGTETSAGGSGRVGVSDP